jgi:hypothetical protein
VTTVGAYNSYPSAVVSTDSLGASSFAGLFTQLANLPTFTYDSLSGTLNVSSTLVQGLSPTLVQANYTPAAISVNTTVAYEAPGYGFGPVIGWPVRNGGAVPFDPYMSFDALFRTANPHVRRKTERARARLPERSSQLIAEWEGYVTKIEAQTFNARLRGVSGKGVEGEIEDAIIPIREVGTRDNPQFAIGALFRLCVSEIRSSDEEVQTSTKLVFRRLPAYRREDLEAARKRGLARAHAFRLDNRRTASGTE